MSLPGKRGQRRMGEVDGGGDDPGNKGDSHGYTDVPYQGLFALERVDSDGL